MLDAYFLLMFDEMLIRMLLEPLISIIDAKLFEAILLVQKSSQRIQVRLFKVGTHHNMRKGQYQSLYTLSDSNPHISRMLTEHPILSFPVENDKFIFSTSQSNKLA